MFIHAWVSLIMRHDRLVELYSLMNVSILPYTSEGLHAAIQARQDQVYFQIAELVRQALPFLSKDASIRFCLYEIHYAMALMPISRRFTQSGVRSDIDPGDFGTVYSQFLQTLLSGLKVEASR